VLIAHFTFMFFALLAISGAGLEWSNDPCEDQFKELLFDGCRRCELTCVIGNWSCTIGCGDGVGNARCRKEEEQLLSECNVPRVSSSYYSTCVCQTTGLVAESNLGRDIAIIVVVPVVIAGIIVGFLWCRGYLRRWCCKAKDESQTGSTLNADLKP
jgi:hypothetical protein